MKKKIIVGCIVSVLAIVGLLTLLAFVIEGNVIISSANLGFCNVTSAYITTSFSARESPYNICHVTLSWNNDPTLTGKDNGRFACPIVGSNVNCWRNARRNYIFYDKPHFLFYIFIYVFILTVLCIPTMFLGAVIYQFITRITQESIPLIRV